MPREYFADTSLNRARLFWAVATRRQLERWESLVATVIRRAMAGGQPEGSDVWSAEMEHHFALIAARNLFRALDLPPVASTPVDPILRTELIEGRDLHEHWPENMPVLMVTPRVAQPPRRSGKNFADRNPDRGPYWWLGWTSKTGALLLPHVPAAALHEMLDAVEAEVLADDHAVMRFAHQRAPSPWIHEDGEWWPKPGVPND